MVFRKTISFGKICQVRQAWPSPPLPANHACQKAVRIDSTYQKIRSVSRKAVGCVHGCGLSWSVFHLGRFDPRPSHVRFVDKMEQGWVFVPVLWLPPCQYHISFVDHRLYITGVATTLHAVVACKECHSGSWHVHEADRERRFERFPKQMRLITRSK